jgi:hypothetical protein
MKGFGDIINNSRSDNPGKLLSKPNTRPDPKKKKLLLKQRGGFREPSSNASKRLIVKQKTIRVLLKNGSSCDLLFIKGISKYIPTLKRAVPQLRGTSNGTFITKKVGEITLSFIEYSASKSIHLIPDIVEYKAGAPAPLYDMIIGKQTMHDIGAVLDLKLKKNHYHRHYPPTHEEYCQFAAQT